MKNTAAKTKRVKSEKGWSISLEFGGKAAKEIHAWVSVKTLLYVAIAGHLLVATPLGLLPLKGHNMAIIQQGEKFGGQMGSVNLKGCLVRDRQGWIAIF